MTQTDMREEQQPRKPALIESLPIEVLVTILSAAAVFRHQTLSRIENGYSLPDEIALVDSFFALFKPWELHQLYRREDVMPPLAPAEDDVEEAPPFARVDAHDGLNCQRWGIQVPREALSEGQNVTTTPQNNWIQHNLGLWRWLGFQFWDRGRVQLLKTGVPVCETGWLTVAPPSDEECEKLYRKVRMGDPYMGRSLGGPTDTLTGYYPAVILCVPGNTGLREAPTWQYFTGGCPRYNIHALGGRRCVVASHVWKVNGRFLC